MDILLIMELQSSVLLSGTYSPVRYSAFDVIDDSNSKSVVDYCDIRHWMRLFLITSVLGSQQS